MKGIFKTLLFAVAAIALVAAPLAASAAIPGLLAFGLLSGAVAATAGPASHSEAGLHLHATIDVSALNAAYGAKYADGSKGLKDLHTRLFQGAKFDSLFELEYTRQNVVEGGLAAIGDVTQPFQVDWSKKGTIAFTPTKSTLQRLKIDWSHSSYEVYGSWVGFLRKEGVSEGDQAMLLGYVLDLISKKHVEEVELSIAYKGVYSAPGVPGTAGAVADSIDGVRKRINDLVTATSITPIATGAILADPVDFVTQVEAFVAGIDSKDRSNPLTIAMASELYNRFRRGMRTKYNSQHMQVAELDQLIDYPHIKVAGFEAMSGSSKIFCTPQGNAKKYINLYDQNGVKTRFNFESQDRTFKCWTDYAMAYHFIDPSRVYVNDQTV